MLSYSMLAGYPCKLNLRAMNSVDTIHITVKNQGCKKYIVAKMNVNTIYASHYTDDGVILKICMHKTETDAENCYKKNN